MDRSMSTPLGVCRKSSTWLAAAKLIASWMRGAKARSLQLRDQIGQL